MYHNAIIMNMIQQTVELGSAVAFCLKKMKNSTHLPYDGKDKDISLVISRTEIT